MTMYPPEELEASLRRAFVDQRADFIILDSAHQKFLIESALFGFNQGWLTEKVNEPPPWPSQDGASIEYRLTEAGRKHFGLEKK